MITMLQLFGKVDPPPGFAYTTDPTAGGIPDLLNVIINLLIVIAGLYTLFNLIFAGFQYIQAGGDSKAVEAAWAKIWQSLVGLFIVAAAVAIAALIGFLFFGDATFILRPKLFKPIP